MPTLTPAQQKRQFLVRIVIATLLLFFFFALFNVMGPEIHRWQAQDADQANAPSSSTAPPLVPKPASFIDPTPLPPPRATSVTTSADDDLRRQEIETARRIQAEALALAKSRLSEVRHLGDEALARCDTFNTEIKRWSAIVPALLTNDDGRHLAGKLAYVQAYRSLQEQPRPDRDTGRHSRAQLAQLLAPIDAALADTDSAYSPSATLIAEIEREKTQVTNATEVYQRHREQIEAMVADAKASNTPAPKTLQAVMADLVAQEVEAHARAIGAAHEVATGQVRDQLAQAEKKKVLAIGKAEKKHVEAKQKAETTRIETDTNKTLVNAERERLLALARDSAIQQKYAPFLSAGTRYPARYEGSVRWLERKPHGRTMPRPCSLAELKNGGVLDSIENFVVAGSSTKCRTSAQNDRPHWPLPSTTSEWQNYSAMYREFQELLPIWVETGVVSPR